MISYVLMMKRLASYLFSSFSPMSNETLFRFVKIRKTLLYNGELQVLGISGKVLKK